MSKEKPEKKKVRFRLSIKMTIVLVLFAVILTGTVVWVGGRNYENQVMERYNEIAYQMAETAQEYFDTTMLKWYADYLDSYNKG